MDKRRRKQAKTGSCYSEEVSSIEWEFINMSEQEEDLIFRMYKLVGDRYIFSKQSSRPIISWLLLNWKIKSLGKWDLIAGRIPGRTAEEIERFWIMRHGEVFANRRKGMKRYN